MTRLRLETRPVATVCAQCGADYAPPIGLGGTNDVRCRSCETCYTAVPRAEFVANQCANQCGYAAAVGSSHCHWCAFNAEILLSRTQVDVERADQAQTANPTCTKRLSRPSASGTGIVMWDCGRPAVPVFRDGASKPEFFCTDCSPPPALVRGADRGAAVGQALFCWLDRMTREGTNATLTIDDSNLGPVVTLHRQHAKSPGRTFTAVGHRLLETLEGALHAALDHDARVRKEMGE